MNPLNSASSSTLSQCHHFAEFNLESCPPYPSICFAMGCRGFLCRLFLLTIWNGQVVWNTILRYFVVAFGRFVWTVDFDMIGTAFGRVRNQ